MVVDASELLFRFARENGLQHTLLSGLDPERKKHDSYSLVAGDLPSSTLPLLQQITALEIRSPMRFGNSVVQMCNAVELACQHGIPAIHAPGFWWVESVEPRVDSLSPVIVVGDCSELNPRLVLQGDFYYKNTLRSLYRRAGKSIQGLRCALETIRAQVPLMRPLPPLPHDHLVIHVRSGDVFRGVGHRLYGQPPLAFYRVVLRLAPWRRVIVVCEDKANPVIDPLLAEAAHAVPSVVCELATLERDLDLLLRARSLVCSRGTFLPAVLALSANVKRIFGFEGLWYGEQLPEGVEFFLVRDTHGQYRQEILAGA